MKRFSQVVSVLFLMFLTWANARAVDLNLIVNGAQPSAASPAVNIQRVELSFSRGGPSPSVELNQPNFFAQAKIRYQGNGLVTVRWLVDGYMLSQQAQILNFEGDLTLRSDHAGLSLPTLQPGIHVVQLQLETVGAPSAIIPPIHYTVATHVVATVVEKLRTLEPKNDAIVEASSLEFQWNSGAEFSGYRLEIERITLSKDRSPPKTIQAETRRTRYTPTPAQWLAIIPGDYRWRVQGIAPRGNEFTDWQTVHVTPPTVKPRLIITNVARGKAGEINSNGLLSAEPAPTPSPQALDLAVTPDETLSLRIRLDNQSPIPTNGAMVEIADTRGIVTRQGLPPIKENQFLETSLPWRVPTRTRGGTLYIRIVGADATQLAMTSLTWSASNAIALETLDFRERAVPALPKPVLAEPSSCPKSAGPLGGASSSGMVIDVSRVYTQIMGVVVASGDETKVATNPVLLADEGQALRASIYLEDRGLFDLQTAKWKTCRENVIDTLQASGLSSQEFIELQDQVTVCREEARTDACNKLSARYNDVVRALGGSVDLTADPPDSIPLELVAYPMDDVGIKSAPVSLGILRLHQGEKSIVRSPVWRAPRSGRYLISLHGLGHGAVLIARASNGLPTRLDMAGFQLQVVNYDANASLNHLTGLAKTTWRDDALATDLTVRFDVTNFATNKNPLHGQVTRGQASLAPNSTNRIAPSGHRLDLQKLELTADRAKSTLRYRFPANLAGDHPGVLLTDVNIVNGGEFIVEKTLGSDVSAIPFSAGNGSINLAGSTLILDLSNHLTNNRFGEDQPLTFVSLLDAPIRIRAFASALRNDGFLTGRAPALQLSDAGVTGFGIEATTASANLANGAQLSIIGGTFDIVENRLSGVNLSGGYRESEVAGKRQVLFQALKRVTTSTSVVLTKRILPGYTSEMLDANAPNAPTLRVVWPGLDAESNAAMNAGAYGLTSTEIGRDVLTGPILSAEKVSMPNRPDQTSKEIETGVKPYSVRGRVEQKGDKKAQVRFRQDSASSRPTLGENTASGEYQANLSDGTWLGSACSADRNYDPNVWRITFAGANAVSLDELPNRQPVIEQISSGRWRPGQRINISGHGFGCTGSIIIHVTPEPTRLLRSPTVRELRIEVTDFLERDDSHVSFLLPTLPKLAYGTVAALGADELPPVIVSSGNGSLVFENTEMFSEPQLFTYDTEGTAQ